MNPIRIAPSLLAADFGRLREEVQKAEAGGADLLHLDVMDGHFVPNLTIGPVVIEAVRKVTRLPLDCHLMIMEPEKYAGDFASAGADSITFHAEAVAHDYARKYKERGWAIQLVCQDFFDRARLDRTIESIRGKGKRCGVAINPDTESEVVEFLDRVDLVLVMTVWPGFGGQKFIESAVPKVAKLRKRSASVDLEVDGGLDDRTVRMAAGAGANVIVAGTSVFRSGDVGGAIRRLRESANGV
jgi:ribulose-phosphate 3-epimerase